jgi:hypothetical protein
MIMLHIVQCFFQVIFEGINTVENFVVKFLFSQIVPDMLRGIAPLFKVAHAQTPSQPVVYLGNRPVIFLYPEVVHPPAEVFGELLVPIVHGDKPGPAGQLLDLSLEFAEGLLRPMDLGPTKSEAKKGNLICRDDPAFPRLCQCFF